MTDVEEAKEQDGPPRPRSVPHSKSLPLSSARLPVAHLKTIDLRLMIGGKLEELDKDPMNVEVIIDDPVPDTPTRGKVSLRDEEEVFVSVDELVVETGRDQRRMDTINLCC